MELFVSGLQHVGSLSSLLVMVFSLVLGIAVGALPGLGPLLAIVLLIPFTMTFGAVAGILSLLAVYVGGVYGGSISAIGLGIPGTPMATPTLFDGYPMLQKGEGDRAQGHALVASVFGGIFSALVLIFTAPVLARAALRFGPPEYFLLGVLGLTTIASVSHGAFLKGIMAACFGALVGTIGTEPATGIGRFTLGTPHLARGVDLVAILVGLFAVSEVLVQTEKRVVGTARHAGIKLPSIRAIAKGAGNYLRSATIGTGIGAIPGIGAVVAALVSYSVARDTSNEPESFGEGNPQGIVATETANNAAVGGVLIPTLALAIPGSPIGAVLMGALILLGVSPGPRLFTQNTELLGVIFAGLLVINVLLFPIGRLVASLFSRLGAVQKEYLLPFVLLFAVIGTYSLFGLTYDLWIMWLFGFIGYILRKTGFSLAPVVIGRVLGPILEPNLQRSMAISTNGVLVFFTRPISLAIIIVTVLLVVVLPLINKRSAKIESR